MKQNQSLQLRQGQSLVMTQQLQQSIKLLQLSSLELNEFVEQELEKNPLLQKDEPSAEASANAENAAAPDQTPVSENEQSESLDSNYGDGWQHEGSYDGGHYSAGVHERSSVRRHDDDDSSPEQYISSEKSLSESLHEQMQIEIADPAMRLVASQLIDMLDDGGYLRDSIDELCETLGAEPAMVETTIRALQKLEPTGVFARNLAECLRLQLEERNLLDPMIETLLANLHLLEQGKWQELQQLCKADQEDFTEMLAQIRSLDPFPARQYRNDLAQPVIPDVFVRYGKNGNWLIELNDAVLPNVLLNRDYYIELTGKSRSKDDKKYLSEQLNQASWLVKAIDQRAQTILKVTAEIVRQQESFMLYGIQFLKPLTLKDIAGEVGMHESTISRVTTNKFMATPRGIFELKYFFTSSINASSGADDVSSKTVMYYIRELIDQEPPEKILSDDTIVTLLKNRNIDIARRTVAKYREAMHIPSSVIRRRVKKQRLAA